MTVWEASSSVTHLTRVGSLAAACISWRSISLDSKSTIDIGPSSTSEFSLSPVGIRDVVAPGGASGGGVARGGFRGEIGLVVLTGAGGLRSFFHLPQVSSGSGEGINSWSDGRGAGVRTMSDVRGWRGGVLERLWSSRFRYTVLGGER